MKECVLVLGVVLTLVAVAWLEQWVAPLFHMKPVVAVSPQPKTP